MAVWVKIRREFPHFGRRCPTNRKIECAIKIALLKKASQRFIDKEQLREKLNLPSTRGVDELMQTKRIPFLRLGHRTVRFDWPKVEKALARFEVKARRIKKVA